MFDAEFGAGYVDEAELHHLAASPESAVFLAHRDESILAGVSIVSYTDREARERFAQSFASLGFTGAEADGPVVGCLQSVVVIPAARGHGVGNDVVEKCVQFGRRRSWSALYAAPWVSGTRYQSAGVLARNGFAAVGTIADYWLQDTSAGMSCVVCGARCRCAAVIMRCQLGPS
ncbi:GNAT family N-acetyltransferase [Nocardia sp. NPDC001965]